MNSKFPGILTQPLPGSRDLEVPWGEMTVEHGVVGGNALGACALLTMSSVISRSPLQGPHSSLEIFCESETGEVT